MKIPRILLCAPASGSGKTLITCGILQALLNRGKKPVSFKCGPDYIDPMFHTKVLGTRSRNLDTFFTKEDTLRYLFRENSQDADIAVIEGVMGYYDGIGMSAVGSAYDVSRVTKTPAVLVVNCKGMSLSAAALIQGFADFCPDSNIRGVILNQCSPMVYDLLKEEIEKITEIKVIGYIPMLEECRLESRHLGLIMPDEIKDLRERLKKLADVLEETLDLKLLIKLAETAPKLPAKEPPLSYHTQKPVRVAVARDEAFCFLYEDNLALLERLGAELISFSPLYDKDLPENIDGLLLPGGYPELYAKSLSANISMRAEVRAGIKHGLPVLAECGGFMYLHDRMEDADGISWPMAGVLSGRAYRTGKLGRFGYISVIDDGGDPDGDDRESEPGEEEQERIWLDGDRQDEGGWDESQDEDTPVEGFFDCLGRNPGALPAHEFHYFDSTDPGTDLLAKKPLGNRSWRCIHSSPTMLAGFPHFYYYGNPALPEAFLRKCEAYREDRENKAKGEGEKEKRP